MGLFDGLKSAPGLFGDMIAGPDSPQLSKDQNAQIRKQAILNAGMQMILGSGPRPQGTAGLLDPIIQGIVAGQQTAGAQRAATVEGNLASVDRQRADAEYERKQQSMQAISQLVADANGNIDINALRNLFAQALASGNVEGARSISEVLKVMENVQKPSASYTQVTDAQGRMWNVDRTTGEIKPALAPDGTQLMGEKPGAAARSEMEMQRAFSRERDLRGAYEKAIAGDIAAATNVVAALRSGEAALQGDATARLALLYGFVKALDPNSVVREGEVRLAKAAAPFWQKAKAIEEEYLRGKSPAVPTDMVGPMLKFMRELNDMKVNYLTSVQDYYTSTGSRWGVDPAAFRDVPEFMRNVGGSFGSTAPAAGGGSGNPLIDWINNGGR